MRWSPDMRRLDWLVRRPIAHRGLHGGGAVENTAGAFEAAAKAGYAIECDLQLSRDGEAMVFHDGTLDRLTLETGLVRERKAEDLKAVAFKKTADRMQTLGELLEQIAGRVPLVIEIKSEWDGDETLAARALDALARYPGPHALMSFDPRIVAAIRERSPDTVRGIVADRGVDPFYNLLPCARRIELQTMSHLADTQPDFISFHRGDLPWAPVTRFRAAGAPVIVWTVRDRGQASRYGDQITFEGFAA
jgi:glycerophosphoryl diester phosphodiesterase